MSSVSLTDGAKELFHNSNILNVLLTLVCDEGFTLEGKFGLIYTFGSELANRYVSFQISTDGLRVFDSDGGGVEGNRRILNTIESIVSAHRETLREFSREYSKLEQAIEAVDAFKKVLDDKGLLSLVDLPVVRPVNFEQEVFAKFKLTNRYFCAARPSSYIPKDELISTVRRSRRLDEDEDDPTFGNI
jgi:hypothetical protein